MKRAETVEERLAQKRWTTDRARFEIPGNIILSDGTKVLDEGRVLLSDNVTIMSSNERWTAAMIVVKHRPEAPDQSAFYGVYELYDNRPLGARVEDTFKRVFSSLAKRGGNS